MLLWERCPPQLTWILDVNNVLVLQLLHFKYSAISLKDISQLRLRSYFRAPWHIGFNILGLRGRSLHGYVSVEGSMSRTAMEVFDLDNINGTFPSMLLKVDNAFRFIFFNWVLIWRAVSILKSAKIVELTANMATTPAHAFWQGYELASRKFHQCLLILSTF